MSLFLEPGNGFASCRNVETMRNQYSYFELRTRNPSMLVEYGFRRYHCYEILLKLSGNFSSARQL